MKSVKQVIKNKPKLKKCAVSLIGACKKTFMFMANKIIGVRQKKIVFISFGGKSYSDNPRAISEKLHEMHPEAEIVWLFNNPEIKRGIVPDYVNCIKSNSFKALKELATAKFWVDNFTKPLSTYKSKNQVYIQTWHGDRGFKKVLYDSTFLSKGTKYIENDICDLALSGSNYADNVYKTAFRYKGDILKFGSPRNDILIENDINKYRELRRNLKIDENIKIVLYAPTLRRDATTLRTLQPIAEIDWDETIKALEQKTDNKWVCLVRAHSAVKGLSGMPNNERFTDVSSYEDMSELLLISDLLITDYSSSAGDFALLNRPIILFQADRDDYIKYDRTFYFDLDKSPYIIVENQEELLKIIRDLDWNTVPQNCKEILDFYGTVETGESSKRVAEYIINKI